MFSFWHTHYLVVQRCSRISWELSKYTAAVVYLANSDLIVLKGPVIVLKSSLGEIPGKSGSVTAVLKERPLASSRSMWEPIRNVCLAWWGEGWTTDLFQNCCFRNSGGGPRDSCYTSPPVDSGVNKSLRSTGPPVMYIISDLTYTIGAH